jgi:hypothetical protein
MLELLFCLTGAGLPCTPSELADPVEYRQVLVLPTGYQAGEADAFRATVEKLIWSTSQIDGPVYSSRYRDRLLYIGHWVPGGALGTAEAAFAGRVSAHPIRGKALSLDQARVHAEVETLQATTAPWLRPWGVAIVFNTREDGITANASPPSFISKSYGVAKMTAGDLEGHYIASHEIAHAALNFVDEYIEPGFDTVNITMFDALMPAALLNGTVEGRWEAISDLLGVHDYRVSEVLAANGNENVDVTRYPSRVETPGYAGIEYRNEGGMFFGRGTWHAAGKNLMGSHRITAPDDGFGYDHSEPQRQVVEQAFEEPCQAPRPNDRLRNAGPKGSWPATWTSSIQLLIYDGDKNHHYHPSLGYDVQIGWYARDWKVCWKGPFPYPCYDQVWTTVEKQVTPSKKILRLRASRIYGLASVLQKVACHLGFKELPAGGQRFKLCELSLDEITEAFVPTVEFLLPYERVVAPAPQWMTRYFWRFRARNASWTSGWTGWSSYKRAL